MSNTDFKQPAVVGKRDPNPSRVLTPEDLIYCPDLSTRMERLTENRCEVFLHNVACLCKKYHLSQSQLCSDKLKGLVSSAQFTNFKKKGRDIPVSVIALVAGAFGLTMEELCGQLLDQPGQKAAPATPDRPLEEYGKYIGTYDMSYFDTAAPLGRNTGTTADSLDRAVLTIYGRQDNNGMPIFRVMAIFNCTPEERSRVTSAMEHMDSGVADPGGVRELYIRAVTAESESGRGRAHLKNLYEGELRLEDHLSEVMLHQCHGGDSVHILAHNRAAQSSDGKLYRGGLATVMSMSRGAEHMPCVQTAILMRSKPSRTIVNGVERKETSTCVLDAFPPEVLASRLYLAPPEIDFSKESQVIIQYMRLLFTQGEEGSPVAMLSDTDKAFCLENFVERKLTEASRRNLLSYYKLSLEMDSEVYAMIQQAM